MSDEPQAACPECGKAAQRLLSGGAGLIFKGEGFYITDYRSEAYKKDASSDKEAASPEKKASRGDAAKKSSGGADSSDGGGGGVSLRNHILVPAGVQVGVVAAQVSLSVWNEFPTT